eukprot:4202139-Amphidinium_carterae.1
MPCHVPQLGFKALRLVVRAHLQQWRCHNSGGRGSNRGAKFAALGVWTVIGTCVVSSQSCPCLRSPAHIPSKP